MNFYMPTMVYQENDAVKNHSGQMAGYGKKAMVVTGKHSSKQNGALQDVIDGLENTIQLILSMTGLQRTQR